MIHVPVVLALGSFLVRILAPVVRLGSGFGNAREEESVPVDWTMKENKSPMTKILVRNFFGIME